MGNAESESETVVLNEQQIEVVLAHIQQVHYVARRIIDRLPAHVEYEDLVGAGALGLIDAIIKYDPSHGVQFKTYAEIRIRGEILDSLRALDWSPRSLRKKSKDLEKVYMELEHRHGRPATDDEVCAQLGLSLEAFYELLDEIKALDLGSFQELALPDSHGDGSDPLVRYAPDDPQKDTFLIVHRSEIRKILAAAVDELPERERMVVSLYYLDQLTMKEIGKILKVNESRVSQLHTKAMLRLRLKLRVFDPKHPGPIPFSFRRLQWRQEANPLCQEVKPSRPEQIPQKEESIAPKRIALKQIRRVKRTASGDLIQLLSQIEQQLTEKQKERAVLEEAIAISKRFLGTRDDFPPRS